MGEFFNKIIMPMTKIPLGKKKKADSLEGARLEFTEEQNAEHIHSEESGETGTVSPTGDEQREPVTVIPVRQYRKKRARRISKGVVAETRNKQRV